ncbi:hypothetical protein ABPG74_015291 [Tetrahymena malaccensis]
MNDFSLKQKNQFEQQKQFQPDLKQQQNIFILCDENYFYKFSQEQNNLNHQNEVEIIKNFIIPLNNTISINGKNTLFAEYFLIGDIIRMKKMQMNLEQFLLVNSLINENNMKQILQQILSQISIMHFYQITHGDIKLTNILVDILPNNQIIAKIIDFQTSSYHQTYFGSLFKPKGFSISNTPTCYLKLWKKNIFSRPYNPFDMDLHQIEILIFQLYAQVAKNQVISRSLKDFINLYPKQRSIFQILNHRWIKSVDQ